MKNFSKFMRHFQLINCRIIVYAAKEIGCIARGGSLKPSFTPEYASKYIKEIVDGKPPKALPMGAYEYSCCVEYLKLIRSKLWKNRENFDELVLVFGEVDRHGCILLPVEDCLEMVAKETGFSMDEKVEPDKYVYTLKSVIR